MLASTAKATLPCYRSMCRWLWRSRFRSHALSRRKASHRRRRQPVRARRQRLERHRISRPRDRRLRQNNTDNGADIARLVRLAGREYVRPGHRRRHAAGGRGPKSELCGPVGKNFSAKGFGPAIVFVTNRCRKRINVPPPNRFIRRASPSFHVTIIPRALTFFEKAIELDSTYAEAWYQAGFYLRHSRTP